MDKSADIAVVGAGVIGLSCAWRLAQRGLRVLLLEQGDAALGASPFSLGVLSPPSPLKQGGSKKLHRESLRLFASFAAELEDESSEPLDYQRCGSLEVIPTESQYIQAVKEIETGARGENAVFNPGELKLLSSAEAKAIEPDAESTVYGALLNEAAACVSVERTLSALRNACLHRNVQLIGRCRVTGVVLKNGTVQGLELGDETVSCGTVIAAAGAWTPLLHPLLAEFCPTIPVRGQALLVESERPLCARVIRWDKRYAVPMGGNLLALGSTTEKDSGFSAINTAEGVSGILQAMLQAIPALKRAALKRMWAGLRPGAVDSSPFIGPLPGVRGLFAAAGHYKTGFSFAPLTSQAAAELITAGKCSFDLSAVAPRCMDEERKKDGRNKRT